MIINISVRKFDEFIKSMNQEKNSAFFIINKDGKIISHTDPSNYLSDFSDKNYVQRIVESNKQEGSFTSIIEGERSIVSYVALERLDWWFVSVIPYNIALKNVVSTRNTILILALIILFSLIALDFLVTKKLYSPIRELVNSIHKAADPSYKHEAALIHNNDIEYLSRAFSSIIKRADSLEESFRNNALFIKNETLKNIILNNYTSLKNVGKRLKQLDIDLSESGFIIIIFSLDNYKVLNEQHTDESLSLFRFSINNIASELIKIEFSNEGVDMGSDHVAIIVNTKRQEAKLLPLLKKACEEDIQSAVMRYLELSITASIGSYTDMLENVFKSYRYAKQQLNYRIVFGCGSVILPDMINIDPNKKYKYPEQIEKNILDNLRLRKMKKVDYYMYKFLEAIMNYQYNDIVLSLINLTNSSIRTLTHMSGDNQEDCFTELRNVLSIIEASSGIEDIKHWFVNAYGSIINTLDSAKDTHREDMVSSVQEYIINNFRNPILSIEEISDIVNISPNYLRTIFKEVTGETVSECINKNRFEMAYQLLKTTNYTTAKIAEMTGFNSTTYFYTAFKKRFGLTPDNYRKRI